jgi:HlyD family secretion protein
MATPATPVYTLALLDPVWIRTYVPEPILGKVAPGMRAEVRTDSYPDKVYSGWVGFISPSAEFTPKTVQTPELRTRLVYQMRVYTCDPNNELRLGMPATVTIPLSQPRGKNLDNNSCDKD